MFYVKKIIKMIIKGNREVIRLRFIIYFLVQDNIGNVKRNVFFNLRNGKEMGYGEEQRYCMCVMLYI